ncbi:MAG: Crp/Fnr family transcriptional regulator [Gammaproteobacteria bacterium]|nr:Crp/Fnr family transcriptional regulator [Gammaproteobacteria bacterium]
MSTRVFEVNADMLMRIDALSMLSESDRVHIARHCQGYSYGPGDLIVSHHESEHDVYFIYEGEIRVTIFAPTGREVTFRDQGAGEMFGELSAIDREPRSAHIVARSAVSLIKLDGDTFLRLLNEMSELNLFTHRRLAALVRSLSIRVYELSALAVRSRVHAEVLRLARAASEDRRTAIIRPPPKHQEIASLIGTTREAVARVFKELKDEQIIDSNHRELRVLSIDALVDLLAGRGGEWI